MIEFWKVSGRGYQGWITHDENKCPHCLHPLGPKIERPVTRQEFYGIILPRVMQDGSIMHISVEAP